MSDLEEAIQKRMQENEKHARSLRSQSRHSVRRLNRELDWVLDLIENLK